MVRGEVKKGNLFQDTFTAVYGDRWKSLREAMLLPSPKVALWNRHSKVPKADIVAMGMVEKTMQSGLSYFVAAGGEGRGAEPQVEESELPQPPRDDAGIPAYYLLDLASVLVVEALKVEPFSRVLDLCAAPGGKSVAISQCLAVSAELTSNEFNAERCKRLKRCLHEHIPSAAHAFTVSQKDGTTWHIASHYDRVLVDAPCSSERHLMTQPDGLSRWTAQTTKDQAAVQCSLLLRGLEALKVGGILVYSTCSISPVENDGVVRAALKRTRVGAEVLPGAGLENGEVTPAGGSMLLPDAAGGMGPMYCCVLRRNAAKRADSESESDSSSDAAAESDGDE